MREFNFDFGDAVVEAFGRRVSFRVYTDENVYTPDPATIRSSAAGDSIRITADGFAYAGLQCRADGAFEATLTDHGEITCEMHAEMAQRIKGTAVRVYGVQRGEICTGHFEFCSIEEVRRHRLHYPNPLFFPALIVRSPDDRYAYAISEDSEAREKQFDVHDREDGFVIDLHHFESASKWNGTQDTPRWRIGVTDNAEAILGPRIEQLETHWGLAPWATRRDVPDWMRSVGLVVNLHGAHWSGFIYNDYASQLGHLRTLSDMIAGRHILAYLPAWDGRYNYSWPKYEACDGMGGEDGLRALVDGAHELGVHVIPQYGAVSANRRYLPSELHECAARDGYGNTYVKEVEWDGDGMPDTYRVNANIGHPGFREFMIEKISDNIEKYHFDGTFMDITQTFHNDPRFNITEGHCEFARTLKQRFEDHMLFAEHTYDLQMGAYPLSHCHAGNLPEPFRRYFEDYCRVTYHLTHPAPGGSSGVYESGFLDPFIPDPNEDIIPCLAVVHDTFTSYAAEVGATIDSAKAYMERKGIE